MNLWARILRMAGWTVEITVPPCDKCVICVAPHTSNWDFILGLFAYRSLGRKANFLMKKFWFFFPLKYLLKSLGGIPVGKKGEKNNLTSQIIEKFKSSSYLNLAITPEGTRSARSEWRTGFLHIAYAAKAPILLGVIDYKEKKVIIRDEFEPSSDIEKDMRHVKEYYKSFEQAAKYPEQFKL